MKKPLVSVVIPNWNGMKFLSGCLDSLRRQNSDAFEVIIVDNGSTDSSVHLIQTSYPEFILLKEPQNLGWGAAVNKGILKSQSEYVVLLNNDVELKDDFIDRLVQASKEKQDYGMFGVKILAFDDRSVIDSLGESLNHNWSTTKRFHHTQDISGLEKIEDIFGPSATAAMYKRDLFDDVGLFDEDFFIGYDDPDLHFRAQMKGYKCTLISSAVVYHIGHGTADFKSSQMKYLMTRNSYYFLLKNIPTWFLFTQFGRIIGFHLVWTMKDIIKIAFGDRHDDTIIRMRARIDFAKNFRKVLKKRVAIQKTRKVSLGYLSSLRTN